MDSGIGQKIKEQLKKCRISVTELAVQMDMTRSNIYKMFESQSITMENLSKLSKILDYDFIDYYSNSLNVSNKRAIGVPFYNVNVYAGLINSLQEDPPAPDDYVSMPGVIADFAVPVSGDSMHPDYKNGDIILCKRFTDLDMIPYGHAFVVQAGDLNTLKYVRKADESGYVRLVSANPAYDPIDLPAYRISKLFRVVGKFSENRL